MSEESGPGEGEVPITDKTPEARPPSRHVLWYVLIFLCTACITVGVLYVAKVKSVVDFIDTLVYKHAPARQDCVGAWGQWDDCSSSCGGGVQTRTYTVITPREGDGEACPEEEGRTQTQPCNAEPCVLSCGDGSTTVSGPVFDLTGLPPQPTVGDLSACPSPPFFPLCAQAPVSYCIANDSSEPIVAGTVLRVQDGSRIGTIQPAEV